jgi:hypothetical protein
MATTMRHNDLSSILDTSIDNLKELQKKFDDLDYRTQVLELQALGKITGIEMTNLIKMLQSVDEENHVVAKEAISNLMKTI